MASLGQYPLAKERYVLAIEGKVSILGPTFPLLGGWDRKHKGFNFGFNKRAGNDILQTNMQYLVFTAISGPLNY